MTTQQNHKTYYVYKHTFQNDTCYIGKGTDRRAYRFYNRGKKWNDTSKKYGNPIVEILYDFLSEYDALNIEIQTIKEFKEKNIKLLNITDGGDGISGYRFSDKQKQEQSERLTNLYNNNDELRSFISECVKKSFQDEDVKRKHKEGNIKAWTDERRAKLSETMKKRYEDPSERLKTSLANKKRFEDPKQREIQSIGTKKRYENPEERIKTAESSKKYMSSPEARKKVSDGNRARWEEFRKNKTLQSAIIINQN